MKIAAGDGSQDGKPGADGAGDSITINIGGEAKTLDAAAVTAAMEKAGNLEKTVEGLSGFQKILTQYGVSAEDYLKNSEASFALANSLISKGVIDDQGNLIEPEEGVKPGDKTIIPVVPVVPADTVVTKQLATIEKAIIKLGGKIETVEDGQSSLYRRNVNKDVKDAHPGLNDDDVSKLLGIAQADKSKGFWDHAETMAKEKSTNEEVQVNTIAKTVVETLVKAKIIPEGKVDLESFNLNKLKEQDPAAAGPVYEGKKFMFSSRKRKLGDSAKDFVAPSEGMKEMLDQKYD